MRQPGGIRAPILVAALVLAAAACSPAAGSSTGPVATASSQAPAGGSPGTSPDPSSVPASIPSSPVSGVLVGIDAEGLSEVTGFTLRLDDGRSFEFLVGRLENPVAFPPGHLAEHMATSTPVRVSFRVDGTTLVAYRLEDAE